MKKLYLAIGITSAACAGWFAACSDNTQAFTASLNEMINQSIGECSAATEGNIKLSAADNSYYVCQGGAWVPQSSQAIPTQPATPSTPTTGNTTPDQGINTNTGSNETLPGTTPSTGNNNQQGGSNTQQGGSNNQQGGNNNQQGGDNTQQGGSNTQQGGSNNQQGGDNTQQGGDNTQQGGDNNQQGGDNNQQGGDNTQQGGDNNQQGGDNAQQGGNNNQQGGNNTQQGGDNNQQGGDNNQQGGDNNQQGGDNSQSSASQNGNTETCNEGDQIQDVSTDKYVECINGKWEEIDDPEWEPQVQLTYTNNLKQSVTEKSPITPIIITGVTSEQSISRKSYALYFLEGSYNATGKSYTITGTVPEWFVQGSNSGVYTDTWEIEGQKFEISLTISKQGVSSSSVAQSSSSQAKSSSSVAKSSSSQAKSSSSVAKSSSSQAKSSSSVAKSSSSAAPAETCYDKFSGKYVGYYKEQVGPNSDKYAYSDKCEFQCWWSQDNNQCSATLGSQGGNSGSGGNTTPSSSSVKSSSSQQQISGNCPVIKKKGDKPIDGWGSRYWDCCKPHCSWNGNARNTTSAVNKPAMLCSANNQEIRVDDINGKSGCEGGTNYTCLSQAPRQVCDNISYALIAGPGEAWKNKCGTCVLLTLKGSGQHGGNFDIAGKQIIGMVSNIGYDVQENQFDIMIPGGGVGIFDGCTSQWGFGQLTPEEKYNLMGEGHGGLRSWCAQKEPGDIKGCVVRKCEALFNKPHLADGLAGCLWYANWLDAADNPQFTYEEVECPQDLINMYASTMF